MLVESRSGIAVEWQELQTRAKAIRDLLVMSLWRRESYQVSSVLRDDDPLTTTDGASHGPQWREAVSGSEEPEPAAIQYRADLFTFAEIGVAGVAQWLQLRDQFARALDPIISTRALDHVSPTTLLAQAGPGIEALGYILLIQDGVTPKQAAQSSLASRLTRILKDVGGVLPFDGEQWVVQTVKAYNGLKHANRAAPREIDALNRWRESVLAVRAWVALSLGIEPASLAERLKSDRQANAYFEVE